MTSSHYFHMKIKIPNLHVKYFQYTTILTKMARDSNTRTWSIARSGLVHSDKTVQRQKVSLLLPSA